MKNMLIFIVSLVLMPLNSFAITSENLEELESNCYSSSNALQYSDWNNCQKSIVETLESEGASIEVIPDSSVVGPIKELDSLTKQIEEMQLMIKALQDILESSNR